MKHREPPTTEGVVATRLNNVIVELRDNEGEPVHRETPEGARVYKRSTVLLLAAAAQRAGYGGLSVEQSIGASLLCHLSTKAADKTDALFKTLTTEMAQLIKEALPIVRLLVPRAEAIAHFEKCGSLHTLAFVRATMEPHIACVAIDLGANNGRYLALDHAPVVPSTSLIDASHFSFEALSAASVHGDAASAPAGVYFRLQHAVLLAPGGSFGLFPTEEPMLLKAYGARKAWATSLSLGSVVDVNARIAAGELKSLVQLSEAEHDKQVVQIADRIAGAGVPPSARPRLVLIAGPTSSGKTTFACRLCVALETLGACPTVVSVDAYYRAWQDIDPRGAKHVDWEALESLNLPLLNEQLLSLLSGEEVRVPEYDMKTSRPADEATWTPTRLRPGGLIIMEGIHCLNPELTARVDRKHKMCIAITPLPALALDDVRLFSPTQLRMLRRMVRDYLNRGRSALNTLKQWPGVALGERANIYPNQNHADVTFNSGLCYEANVLKVYAEPLLRQIEPSAPEYSEARRLLAALANLSPMPSTLVPPQSLLREFIGGSWFYDFGGWYKAA